MTRLADKDYPVAMTKIYPKRARLSFWKEKRYYRYYCCLGCFVCYLCSEKNINNLLLPSSSIVTPLKVFIYRHFFLLLQFVVICDYSRAITYSLRRPLVVPIFQYFFHDNHVRLNYTYNKRFFFLIIEV